jgi:hypothetical protein
MEMWEYCEHVPPAAPSMQHEHTSATTLAEAIYDAAAVTA